MLYRQPIHTCYEYEIGAELAFLNLHILVATEETTSSPMSLDLSALQTTFQLNTLIWKSCPALAVFSVDIAPGIYRF